jgi:hypothetical protein
MVTTTSIHEVSTVWLLSSCQFNLMMDKNMTWNLLVTFCLLKIQHALSYSRHLAAILKKKCHDTSLAILINFTVLVMLC